MPTIFTNWTGKISVVALLLGASAPFANAASLSLGSECQGVFSSSDFALGQLPHESVQRSNPFFDPNSQKGVSLAFLNEKALKILAAAPELKPQLRSLANSRLAQAQGAQAPADNSFAADLQAADANIQTLDALEYLLRVSVDSRSSDITAFRGLIIEALTKSPASDFGTIEELLPLARGVGFNSRAELKWSVDAIARISARTGSFPVRFAAPGAPRTDELDILNHEPIQKIRSLGGGINSTWLVTFANGKRAVFKQRSGDAGFGANLHPNWVSFNREVAAIPFLEHFMGLSRGRRAGLTQIMTPPTVETVLAVDGKSYGVGSLQAFETGYQDIEKISTQYLRLWSKIMNSPEWKQESTRIRAMDFLLGNYDRLPLAINARIHPKNMMIRLPHEDMSDLSALNSKSTIDVRGLQLVLIDNSVGFARNDKFDIRTYGHFPAASDIPADLKTTILQFNESDFRTEFQDLIPAAGLQDVIQRVREAQKWIRAS